MASTDAPKPPSSKDPASQTNTNPIVRNALRYSLSEREYDILNRRLLKHSPQLVRRQILPTPQEYTKLLQGQDDFNAAAIRASLRVFVASQTGLKLWEWIATRVLARRRQLTTKRRPFFNSPNFRLAASLSLILFLHRHLFRFFARLRSKLLSKDAAPFRRRNPRISRSLTSKLAPAIGASLAGFALGVYPSDQLRLTITIYTATRSLEFLYLALERDGLFKDRPWWWGSWMLTPLATGQLLYAFVFDRDCFPKAYGDFIFNNTPNYVQKRPLDYPASLPWPSSYQIIDGLAEMSHLRWPPFISPILFPNLPSTLPTTLSSLSPITAPANPSHTSLSCATLHPSDPSCIRTFTQYNLAAFPALAKFFAALYAFFALPRYRKIFADPFTELSKLLERALRTSAFVTGAIGTSWASICLFQAILPRTVFTSSRWFWGGFLGGMWAFVDREAGRGQFLYSVRMSVDSLWKLGKKKGWWKGVRGGDLAIFVVGLAVTNAVYEVRKDAIDTGVGKGIGWLRGEELLAKRWKSREDGSSEGEKSV